MTSCRACSRLVLMCLIRMHSAGSLWARQKTKTPVKRRCAQRNVRGIFAGIVSLAATCRCLRGNIRAARAALHVFSILFRFWTGMAGG